MLKRLAIVSSVALVGGYVLLKAGVDRAIMPSTKSGRVVERAARDRTLMPGSKSNRFDIDGQNLLYGDGTVEFQKGSTTQPTTNPSK